MPVAGTRCTHRQGVLAWSGYSGRVMVVSLPSHKTGPEPGGRTKAGPGASEMC